MLSVGDFNYTLESLCGVGTQFRLKKVSPLHEYIETDEVDKKGAKKKKKGNKNNKKGEQIGFKYSVVASEIGVKFDVKVEGDTVPIIENTDIKKSANPILVTFEDTYASFYGDSLWVCNLSVTAGKIKLVSTPSNLTKPLNIKVQEI